MTFIPIFLVDRDVDGEQAWHGERAQGVTATEVVRLVRGGIQTRRSILADKLHGSDFKGNAHTERGHEREPIIAKWVTRHFGIEANSILWANPDNPLYRCTPDGLGQDLDGDPAGFEVKSLTGEDSDDIDAEHEDQCQWNMLVTGRSRWLYVWERLDEHGQYPLEPSYRWIERDDERIAELQAAADKFIAWRASGAPTVDPDITEALDELISQHVAARRIKNRGERAEKAAEKGIRDLIAADENARTKGWDKSGTDGGLLFAVTPKTTVDEEAWKAADPKGHALYLTYIARAEKRLADATKKYVKPAPAATRLTIAAHKPVKGDAA